MQLLRESFKEIVRREVGKESKGAALSLNIVLDLQTDDLVAGISGINLFVVAKVNSATELEGTVTVFFGIVNLLALLNLALFFSHGALPVNFLALSKFLTDSTGFGTGPR